MIEFNVVEYEEFTLVDFKFDGVLTPEDLKKLKPPEVRLDKGVVISGRGPIWLYGYLIHHYHPAKWVATYDPRLGGGVVVMSHDPKVREGDIIRWR